MCRRCKRDISFNDRPYFVDIPTVLVTGEAILILTVKAAVGLATSSRAEVFVRPVGEGTAVLRRRRLAPGEAAGGRAHPARRIQTAPTGHLVQSSRRSNTKESQVCYISSVSKVIYVYNRHNKHSREKDIQALMPLKPNTCTCFH